METKQQQPRARAIEVDVVEIDEVPDIDRAVQHYVQMALAQLGVPVTVSRSSAA